MKLLVNQLLHTHTVRQSAVTVSSMFLSAFLGAVFYLVLARLLSTADYGLFSLGMLVLQIGVTVADLGLGQGIVRFAGQNRDRDAYFPYANLAIRLKLVTGSFVFISLVVSSRFLADQVFHQPQLASLLPFVGLGVLALAVFGFSLSLFQGLQKFFLWGGMQVAVNLLRLVILVPLFLAGLISPSLSLLSYIVAIFIFFMLGWRWLDTRLLVSPISRDHVRKFFSFNLWTALFGIVTTFVSRIDTFMVARFLTLSQTGVYSLAVTMTTFMPQLSTALGAVSSAKMAGFKNHASEHAYMPKAFLFSAGTSFLVVLLMIPTALVVIRFTGKSDYQNSFIPFLVLVSASLIYTALNPIRDSILYFHSRPKFFFWANLAQGAVLLTFTPALIHSFQALGSAFSVLVSQLLFATLCLWYYYHISRHEPTLSYRPLSGEK